MRVEQHQTITIGNFTLMGLWSSGRGVGWSIGLRLGISRNIHLTVIGNNEQGRLHVHLTDNGKIVWKQTKTREELTKIVETFQKKCIKKYYSFSKYYQFQESFFEPFLKESTTSTKKDLYYDIGPMLIGMIDESCIKKCKIADGYRSGLNIGFKRIWFDTYCVIAVSENEMICLNSDITKTPLWDFPICQGLFKLCDYLEENKILDQSPRYSEERMEQAKLALTSLLAQQVGKADISDE